MHAEAEPDELDLRLLEALQLNARSTFAELAALVGLKPPAVHDRVKRLERLGFVRSYGARLDARRLGIGLVAFVSAYTTPERPLRRLHRGDRGAARDRGDP